MRETSNADYREILNKPLEKITEDVFFRADNFQNEPWYGDFKLYLFTGVCQPKPEHILELQKALKIMGYPTHTFKYDGKLFVVPGEVRNTARKKDRER